MDPKTAYEILTGDVKQALLDIIKTDPKRAWHPDEIKSELCRRWKEAEDVIKTDLFWAFQYYVYVIEDREERKLQAKLEQEERVFHNGQN